MSEFKLNCGSIKKQKHLVLGGQAAQPAIDNPSPVAAVTTVEDFFGPPISVYTRQQAIEDGVLVQLSGDGYEGDEWIPQMVAEAGIKWPLAVTTPVFMDCIGMTKAAERALNDIRGRLWDVLWMFSEAVRRLPAGRDQFLFELYVVVNRVKPSRVQLKAVCGPGDDGEPVITIMYPHED